MIWHRTLFCFKYIVSLILIVAFWNNLFSQYYNLRKTTVTLLIFFLNHILELKISLEHFVAIFLSSPHWQQGKLRSRGLRGLSKVPNWSGPLVSGNSLDLCYFLYHSLCCSFLNSCLVWGGLPQLQEYSYILFFGMFFSLAVLNYKQVPCYCFVSFS